MILDNSASAAAQLMNGDAPVSLAGIGQMIADPIMAEVRGNTLFCRTESGTVECEIDIHGVAWVYQVTGTEELLWWSGRTSQDNLRGHIKAAIDNANKGSA